jgi:hypothetical protein
MWDTISQCKVLASHWKHVLTCPSNVRYRQCNRVDPGALSGGIFRSGIMFPVFKLYRHKNPGADWFDRRD